MALPYPFHILPEEWFPSALENAILVAVQFLIVFGFAYMAGYLRVKKGVKVGYTRKIFHFAIFTTAGVSMWGFGYGPVLELGAIGGLFLLITIVKGEGFILYEGIAREEDAPDRTYYLVVPFLATAAAGLLSIFFFKEWAIVGFFVAGWGDAAGEPIGTRFGKHKVSLPFFGRTNFTRSLEGSIGVFVVSMIAAGVALGLSYDYHNLSVLGIILIAFPVALVAMVTEFFSPHGADNFTVQLFAAMTAAGIFNILS